MAPIRLRHPKGTSTIEVGLDSDDCTVQDVQQKIYTASGILPSRQIRASGCSSPTVLFSYFSCRYVVKTGYPPRPLTLIPELPVSSLGLQRGDQIFVNEANDNPAALPRGNPIPHLMPSGSVSKSSGPNSVQLDGGFLIHRVRSESVRLLYSIEPKSQVVPDDNSCLFSSVALIFEQDIKKAPQMRKSRLST